MVCSAAGQAQIGVALPHRQVAGTLLGVALSFAPTARETVLTCIQSEDSKVSFSFLIHSSCTRHERVSVLTLRAALTKLLAEVLSGDARTRGVAGLPGVVTWLVVIHVIG